MGVAIRMAIIEILMENTKNNTANGGGAA